jgi:hypothetical protein
MGVRGVWYSPDRRLRVELRDERGRQAFRVVDRSMPVGEFPDADKLGEFLRERYALGFADLVED